jgi:hypothetical protein
MRTYERITKKGTMPEKIHIGKIRELFIGETNV